MGLFKKSKKNVVKTDYIGRVVNPMSEDIKVLYKEMPLLFKDESVQYISQIFEEVERAVDDYSHLNIDEYNADAIIHYLDNRIDECQIYTYQQYEMILKHYDLCMIQIRGEIQSLETKKRELEKISSDYQREIRIVNCKLGNEEDLYV